MADSGEIFGDDASFEQLFAAVRRGDRSAQDVLCARLLPGLRRWASRRLPAYAREMVDTDDLTQDVMLQTLNRVDAIRVDREGFVAYLRTAMLNRIRDEIRRSTRRPPPEHVSLEGRASDEESPLENLLGKEAVSRYETALESLDVREREAVILRIEMGFTYPEIAGALDWNSANAARMAVTRAVERMATGMSQADA